MDTTTYYTLLENLIWILAVAAAGIGVVYIFVKPSEKKQ